jgi:hypothetical protein
MAPTRCSNILTFENFPKLRMDFVFESFTNTSHGTHQMMHKNGTHQMMHSHGAHQMQSRKPLSQLGIFWKN